MKRIFLTLFLWLCWLSAAIAQFVNPVNMRDANLALSNTQNFVTTLNTFTAQRTLTIPGAGAMNAYYLQFVDTANAINGSNTLRIVAADGSLINGGASATVSVAGSYVFIVPSPSGYSATIIQNAAASNPGGSSGQIQYNNAGSFGGFTTSGDATINTASGALTLTTVNPDVGTVGTSALVPQFTVNGKGLITAATTLPMAPAISNVTGLGGGIAAALATSTGNAGAPVLFNGAGGTPSSLVGTNITSLNGSQITSGTVPSSRGGAGSITGALAGNGAGVVTQAASTQLSDATAAGSWAPVDQSGAGLSFSSVSGNFSVINKTCVGNLRVTFPSTANGSNARLSTPCSAANNGNQAVGACFTTAASPNGTLIPLIIANTAAITFINTAGSAVSATNANLSTATVTCSFAFITP